MVLAMAVKLTLVLSGRTLKRFEFDEFEKLRIGRNDDCEILIENLGVSRYHAEIVAKDGFHVLKDLQSNNGTYVNGHKVDQHNLNSGDVITIGKYAIEYQVGRQTDERKAQTDPELPVAVDGAMTMQVDPAALARMANTKTSRMARGYLAFKSGPPRPSLALEKPLITFGTDADADVRLEGWFCPRVVAVIVRDDAGFRLLDVSNRGNGVVVNGKPRKDVRLTDNDEIRMRDRVMVFNRGAPGQVG
jgi:pSer/pThr/pTyr-binding forkhead associated (FHA) protein